MAARCQRWPPELKRYQGEGLPFRCHSVTQPLVTVCHTTSGTGGLAERRRDHRPGKARPDPFLLVVEGRANSTEQNLGRQMFT
jgi:hypothetical protein